MVVDKMSVRPWPRCPRLEIVVVGQAQRVRKRKGAVTGSLPSQAVSLSLPSTVSLDETKWQLTKRDCAKNPNGQVPEMIVLKRRPKRGTVLDCAIPLRR